MNRRDAIFRLLDGGLHGEPPQSYIPAAFFLHFPAGCLLGEAAADKHREFFRFTGMDLVKIQYERPFPAHPLKRPADWAHVPLLNEAYFEPQLVTVRSLVESLKAEAPVVVTLYSPFMCAGQVAVQAGGQQTLTEHLQEDPEAVAKGLEIITENLLVFVRACIRLGVDGFYHSTQGGESRRFPSPTLFTRYVKPFDLQVMKEIEQRCPFNILHICDYHRAEYGGYDDLTPFLDYPGHIVNCSLEVGGETLNTEALSRFFGRPFMGGMERTGTLATGTETEVREEARAVLKSRPGRFFLGADCTVPFGTPWDNLRVAIDQAHQTVSEPITGEA